MPEDKKPINQDMPQDRTARIDALWNKLQSRKKTKFITGEGNTNPSPAEKEALMRKNLKPFSKENLKNNINSSVGLEIKEVDKNFAKLQSKDTKVLEASLKALDALADVPIANPNKSNPYQKVDSYLKQIDNINKPGLVKQAIKAAGNLGSELRVKLSKHIPSLKPKTQDKKEEKTR